MVSDEGTVIGGRYRLLAPVGRGATSVVWRARDERLDRIVAVKELAVDPADDPAAGQVMLGRAQREGRVAARLDHPHAVTVHDVLTRDGTAFLVMEYVAGESLAASLARRGTLPAPEVAAIGAALAGALTAAHDEGILHRDVKPGNVLVTGDGSVTLVDFGISRIAGEATGTGSGLVAGTPAYLSPEVAAGETVGTAADVFSLGATLLTALEGTPPFGDADDPVALLARIARTEPRVPADRGPLADVLRTLLRRDPGARPTMRQAQEALTGVAEGRPTPAPAPPRPTLALPPPPRRVPRLPRGRVAAGLGAVALVTVGVVLGAVLSGTGGGEDGGRHADAADSPGSPGGTAPPATTASSGGTATPGRSERGCTARYRVVNSWPGGYQAEVTVRTSGQAPLSGWTVRWTPPPGHGIAQVWNGALTRNGAEVVVRDAGWNAVVQPGRPANVGFLVRTPDRTAVAPDHPDGLTCE